MRIIILFLSLFFASFARAEGEETIYDVQLVDIQFSQYVDQNERSIGYLQNIDYLMSEAVWTYLALITRDLQDTFVALQQVRDNVESQLLSLGEINNYTYEVAKVAHSVKQLLDVWKDSYDQQNTLITQTYADIMQKLEETVNELILQNEQNSLNWGGLTAKNLAQEETLGAILQWLQGNRGWGDTHTIEEVQEGVEGIDDNIEKLLELIEPYYTNFEMDPQPDIPLGFYVTTNPETFEPGDRISVYEDTQPFKIDGNFFEQTVSLLWQQLYETIAVKNHTILLLKQLAGTNALENIDVRADFEEGVSEATGEFNKIVDNEDLNSIESIFAAPHLVEFFEDFDEDLSGVFSKFQAFSDTPPESLYFNFTYDNEPVSISFTYSPGMMSFFRVVHNLFDFVWWLFGSLTMIYFCYRHAWAILVWVIGQIIGSNNQVKL